MPAPATSPAAALQAREALARTLAVLEGRANRPLSFELQQVLLDCAEAERFAETQHEAATHADAHDPYVDAATRRVVVPTSTKAANDAYVDGGFMAASVPVAHGGLGLPYCADTAPAACIATWSSCLPLLKAHAKAKPAFAGLYPYATRVLATDEHTDPLGVVAAHGRLLQHHHWLNDRANAAVVNPDDPAKAKSPLKLAPSARGSIGPVGEPADAVAAAGGARGRRVAVLRAAAEQRGSEAHRAGIGPARTRVHGHDGTATGARRLLTAGGDGARLFRAQLVIAQWVEGPLQVVERLVVRGSLHHCPHDTLDVLHDAANDDFVAVADRVNIDFDRCIEELVNQQWAVFREVWVALQVVGECHSVVDNLHCASTKHEAGAHQYGVANLSGCSKRLISSICRHEYAFMGQAVWVGVWLWTYAEGGWLWL